MKMVDTTLIEVMRTMLDALRGALTTYTKRHITREEFMETNGKMLRAIRKAEQVLKLGVVLLSIASVGHAYEFKDNPDRYFSFGVTGIKGQQQGIAKTANTSGQFAGGRVDFRLPIAQNITLNALAQNTGVDNNKEFSEGYQLELGVRIYIRPE